MATLRLLKSIYLSSIFILINAQFMQSGGDRVQVKIADELFPASTAPQISQFTWKMLGRTASEILYCVSENPVSQLRFRCLDCEQKNITDMVHILNSAQDVTRSAGFPAISLKNIDVNPNWNGATITCEAAINEGHIASSPIQIIVQYLRNIHVTDSNNQSPIRIPNSGNVFYVECVRGPDGSCQQTGRRKTLHCSVQANPPPTSYRWQKNGEITSGNGASITIGTEMIGKSIQCSANNGLYPQDEPPTSQAVSIEPYSAARVVQTNFRSLQSSFGNGNNIEMFSDIKLLCMVEGFPRPVVFWRMRRADGQVVDAPCPQGLMGQTNDLTNAPGNPSNNLVRIQATCQLRISSYAYSGNYWCSACSFVSGGNPECSPDLDTPGDETLNIMVQGPPMASDASPSVEQIGTNTAVVTVPYCSEPTPTPPREITFLVDNNVIQLTQTWQNFRFDSVTQNNTEPNCYFARLQISPIHEGDKNRQISLKVTNRYDTLIIPVSLSDLLGDGTSTGNVAKIIVLSILGGIALLVLLAGAIILCVRRQLFCFSGIKEGQYGNPSSIKKTTIGAPQTSFTDDIGAPNGYYGDSKEMRTVPFKSSHEGINYAEMNLTDRQPPIHPATSLQLPQNSDVSYHFKETSQVASTISVNSVV